MQLGERMKSYELDHRLPKGVAIIRIDGKAFHTWTRRIQAKKPFDEVVHTCMVVATKAVMQQAQGTKLAYTQSDESTIMLTNLGENEGAWFDYKVQKLASVAASIFTNTFADVYDYYVVTRGYPSYPAVFDARVYSVPVSDAANVFVWRQQDWNRNSIQMLGHHHFGHKAMQEVPSWDVIGKLIVEKGVDWDDLDSWKKYGTFICPVKKTPEVYTDIRDNLLTLSTYMHYDEINQVAGLTDYLER